MTKDSGGHSDDKGGGQKAPRKNNVLPIDRGKAAARRPWAMSASGISLNSAAGLLVTIGVLCGLLISESDRTASVVTPKQDNAVKASATPVAATTPPHAKPSPAVPVGATRPATPVVGIQPNSHTANTGLSYAPAKFQATHKKMFGGCTGELRLTSSALDFRCANSDLHFPVNAIASANKDGVVLRSGEKYHFAIANRSKDQAEAIFIAWLSRVQPGAQQRGAF